jgi:hypothetical protein
LFPFNFFDFPKGKENSRQVFLIPERIRRFLKGKGISSQETRFPDRKA